MQRLKSSCLKGAGFVWPRLELQTCACSEQTTRSPTLTRSEEMREKERKARELMQREGLDALAITNVGNFAWLTCGGSNYISVASETGAATAVITRDAKYVVC